MHSLLENYLEEVAIHLRPLPHKRRDDELCEMRSHLESAVAAGQARGLSEDDAVRETLQQFGQPETLGRDTVMAWNREKRINRRSFLGATACALALWLSLPEVTQWLIMPVERRLFWVGHHLAHGATVLTFYVFDLIVCSLPTWFLIGIITGLLFPRRAVAGTSLVMGAWMGLLLIQILTSKYAFATSRFWADAQLMRWHVFMNHTSQVSFGNLLFALFTNFLQYLLQALAALLGAWMVSRLRIRRASPARLAEG